MVTQDPSTHPNIRLHVRNRVEKSFEERDICTHDVRYGNSVVRNGTHDKYDHGCRRPVACQVDEQNEQELVEIANRGHHDEDEGG